MFKKLTVYLSIMVFLFAVFPAAHVYASEISVQIDNRAIQYSPDSGIPFVDQSNRTQVPFRSTMESFGCMVNWNGETQTAIAEKGGTVVQVPIGEPYIIKNGRQITNDTAALIKDNRTYLPIRAVLEAFGASVAWESATQSVIVSTASADISNAPASDTPNNIMTVHFLDVGQADSILIDIGSDEILIDGGNNADGPFVVNYLKPYVDGDLEAIVATHAHEDHIGGLDLVISSYQVDQIIYSEETSSTASFRDFYQAASSEPGCKFYGDSDMTLDLGSSARLSILEMGDGYQDPNENSVVSLISYNNIGILFTGDLESTIEKNNLNKFSDIDILKVGHHGSRTSTSQAFLDVVKPETAIISAGLDNPYSLPNSDIISRLRSMNSYVYGTFRSGTIILTTDGYQYRLSTDIQLTPDDAGALSAILQTKAPSISESEAAYIGNAGTMKFHTPECRAGSKISDRNVIYFPARTQAIEQGYIPCKLCNP